MGIRKYNPTSPGVREKTSLTFDEITTNEPYAPLTEKLDRSGGRNNQGHLTSWWRGGGHKRLYRIIDFKRDKKDIPGKVSTIEYDPNRSARIALVGWLERGWRRVVASPPREHLGLALAEDPLVADLVGDQTRRPVGVLGGDEPVGLAGHERGAVAEPLSDGAGLAVVLRPQRGDLRQRAADASAELGRESLCCFRVHCCRPSAHAAGCARTRRRDLAGATA